MKTYTTWNKACRLLAIASILLIGYTATANITNPVPFSVSLESGFASGDSLVGTNGWYAPTNTYAIATNATYTYVGTPPIGPKTGTYAILDTENGTLTNRFSPATNVWVEMMLQPTQWSDDAPPSDTNDCRFLAYVSTNDQLVIYHTDAANWGFPFAAGANRFTTFTNTSVGTSDWVRLSIRFDFTSDSFGGGAQFFKVLLDGTELSSPYGIQSPALGPFASYGGTNGPWHLVANHGVAATVKDVVLSGTGSFDDLVVSETDPVFSVQWAIVASVRSAMGDNLNNIAATMSQTGTNWYPADTTQTVSIVYSNWWDHALTVDGILTPTNNPQVFSESVSVIHTVALVCTMQTTTAVAGVDVPRWWLDDALGNGYADPTADDDGDARSVWEEWLTSTDPTVSNQFEISDHYFMNGTGVVEWVSADVDPSLPPFEVLRTTNLMAAGGGWMLAGYTNRISGGGTNVWIDTNPPPAGVQAFYRVSATN